MKSAEEVLNKSCIEIYEKNADACHFIHPIVILDAMKAYAREALAEAAQKASLKDEGGFYQDWDKTGSISLPDDAGDTITITVDKESITNIELP